MNKRYKKNSKKKYVCISILKKCYLILRNVYFILFKINISRFTGIETCEMFFFILIFIMQSNMIPIKEIICFAT